MRVIHTSYIPDKYSFNKKKIIFFLHREKKRA